MWILNLVIQHCILKVNKTSKHMTWKLGLRLCPWNACRCVPSTSAGHQIQMYSSLSLFTKCLMGSGLPRYQVYKSERWGLPLRNSICWGEWTCPRQLWMSCDECYTTVMLKVKWVLKGWNVQLFQKMTGQVSLQ